MAKHRKYNAQNGFTLTEILVVISVVGFLFGFGLTASKKQMDKGYDARIKTDINKIQTALEHYYNDHECYPDQNAWDLSTCNGSDGPLSPYINSLPCDPNLKTKYIYQTTNRDGTVCTGTCGQCYSYRLMAKLNDSSDPEITEIGCDPKYGCGVTGPTGVTVNWGVAMGHSVPVPGFYPGQGQDTGHTEKHDCDHVKDPGCDNTPSPNPSLTPKSTITPSLTPTSSPTPTPTTAPQGYCVEDPDPTPTPLPIYPANPTDPNNYIYGPGKPYPGIADVPADIYDLITSLEWYYVENGTYPDCNCSGWADVEMCLHNKLAKYTIPYPTGVNLRQIYWPNAITYMYKYYPFQKDATGKYNDYCLASIWAWSISGKWNQQCPIGAPSTGYIWLRRSQQNIIARKPIYANVYPQYSTNIGQQRDAVRKQQISDIKKAIEAYKTKYGHYPFANTYGSNSPYNLRSFSNLLVPEFMSVWIDDPYNTQNEPHAYDVWLSNPGNDGYYEKYCLMAFMDENSNCSNQCPDFQWIYHYKQAFCYYTQN